MAGKTTIERDTDQEPYELDQIQCPSCKKVQQAKIYIEWKRHKKSHHCIECGAYIWSGNWQSLNK